MGKSRQVEGRVFQGGKGYRLDVWLSGELVGSILLKTGRVPDLEDADEVARMFAGFWDVVQSMMKER